MSNGADVGRGVSAEGRLQGSPAGDEWVEVMADALPVAEALEWSVRPDCGAVVTFCGTVRDQSDGRPDVVSLEYEAYLQQVERCLAAIAAEARRGYQSLGRIALLHRVGLLHVGEVSVVVVVSAPHRAEAFEAARYCIDAVKISAPIWKRETWVGGSDWSDSGHEVDPVPRVDTKSSDAPPSEAVGV